MNKQEYIEKLLNDSIKTANEHIKEKLEMVSEVEELPNDCKGVEIDGDICENPDYKFEILTENFHSIGYMEGVKKTAEDVIMLNNFTDIEFEDFLKEQERVRIHNEKVMKDMKDYIEGKNSDL